MENQFWLKVRKEYVFDNFQGMVDYLRKYDYDHSRSNVDYDDTLECVRELVKELAGNMRNAPWYGGVPAGIEGQTPATLVRMMAVAFLGAMKRGETDYDTLLTLVDYLLYLTDELSDEARDGLWKVILGAMRRAPLVSLGFTWNDVATAAGFHMAVFVHKLAHTRFSTTTDTEKWMCEHNGLMLLDRLGDMAFLPMNLDRLSRTATHTFFDIDSMVTLQTASASSAREASTFEGLLREGRDFLNELANVKPSPKRPLLDYAPGDEFVVRVTSINGIRFKAETIDPRYQPLEGKVIVRWPQFYHPDEATVRSCFKEGDLILVRRCAPGGEFEFDMGKAIDDYYRDIVASFANRETDALFIRDTGEGALWVTAEGVRVMIHKSKLQALPQEELDHYNTCVADGIPLHIQFYSEAPDITKAMLKVYAEPKIDLYASDPTTPADIESADRFFAHEFLAEAQAIAQDMPRGTDKMEPLEPEALETAAHALFAMTREPELTTMERLRTLIVAAVAATMVERPEGVAYLQHRMDLLDRMVAFCHNREIRPVRSTGECSTLPDVKEAEELVDALVTYRNPAISGDMALAEGKGNPSSDNSDSGVLERVTTLVEASNSLAGIIGGAELNNVKMAIARAIGVADEFEPVTGDRTFYGSESLTLEFKKSIVFPPVNKRRSLSQVADPERQKWAILKAVCGFLNSRSGGELLLGVNDNGYADGLADDMNTLAQMRLISTADMDHYRLYVQRIIDFAFKEQRASTLSTDIVTLNVSYLPETNPEGKSILRIQVRPYPYGVVEFADNMERPADYESAYVRRDGRTMPLTPALRGEVERYKLQAQTAETRDVIAVSNAIADKRVVLLQEYRSGSGVADRLVEPYKIWKKRGLLYGYDLERDSARLYKLSRAKAVVVTERHCAGNRSGANVGIDCFGMLLDRSVAQTVTLHLTDYGMLLLTEDFPEAAAGVTLLKGGAPYNWKFETQVSSPEGLDRFVRGLPDHVRRV